MINKKIKYEGLIFVIIALILFSVLSIYALNVINKQKYKLFRDDIYSIGNSVNLYTSLENIIYRVYSFEELIDLGMIKEIVSPFDNDNMCSNTESKVIIENNEVYVTLVCDNYLIEKVNYKEININIYSIGEWMDINNAMELDMMLGYNYKIGEDYLVDEYVDKDTFVYLFNKHNKTSYLDISSIQNDYEILSKNMYRTKELIIEK